MSALLNINFMTVQGILGLCSLCSLLLYCYIVINHEVCLQVANLYWYICIIYYVLCTYDSELIYCIHILISLDLKNETFAFKVDSVF